MRESAVQSQRVYHSSQADIKQVQMYRGKRAPVTSRIHRCAEVARCQPVESLSLHLVKANSAYQRVECTGAYASTCSSRPQSSPLPSLIRRRKYAVDQDDHRVCLKWQHSRKLPELARLLGCAKSWYRPLHPQRMGATRLDLAKCSKMLLSTNQ